MEGQSNDLVDKQKDGDVWIDGYTEGWTRRLIMFEFCLL